MTSGSSRQRGVQKFKGHQKYCREGSRRDAERDVRHRGRVGVRVAPLVGQDPVGANGNPEEAATGNGFCHRKGG